MSFLWRLSDVRCNFKMSGDKHSPEYSRENELEKTIDELDESDALIDFEKVDKLDLRDRIEDAELPDDLFDELRDNTQRELRKEVQKALVQPTASKAGLYRMRSKDLSAKDLKEDDKALNDLEEVWGEVDVESEAKRKLILFLLLVAISVSCIYWAFSQSFDVAADTPFNHLNDLPKEKNTEKADLRKEMTEAGLVMQNFIQAETLEVKKQFIYKTNEFEAIMKQFHAAHGQFPIHERFQINMILPVMLADEQLWMAKVQIQVEGAKRVKSYFLRKGVDGKFKVDWKATVGYQENDIEKFVKERSKIPTEFRFIVKREKRIPSYNWGFREFEYLPVILKVPNTDYTFWGYVKRGSKSHRDISLAMKVDKKSGAMIRANHFQYILKVRFLEDSPKENDKYILIDELVSPKWVDLCE